MQTAKTGEYFNLMLGSRQISVMRTAARIHDVSMAALAMFLAVSARYDFAETLNNSFVLLWIGVYAGISAIVYWVFGLGRGIWRFSSIADLRAIVLATALATLSFLLTMFLVNRLEEFPRGAAPMVWCTTIVLVGGPRLLYRAWKDGRISSVGKKTAVGRRGNNLLIIGSASEADQLLRSFGLEDNLRPHVHGILSYEEHRVGWDVRGVPIIGSSSELVDIVERLRRTGINIDTIALAGGRPPGSQLSEVIEAAGRLRLRLRRIRRSSLSDGPDLAELTLEDLLGRQPVELALPDIEKLVGGKVVTITGAGGSIGSELVRQVARLRPSMILLIDHSEFALYEVNKAVSQEAPSVRSVALIADIRDRHRIGRILEEYRPSVIFHAAALKHVPLVEDNECEGILTNVCGTRNVADMAVANDVEAFVMISTDKAINPPNVMGASKRVAEAYCQALDVSGASTRFITVRFGNVLGSNGSVVPLFKQQILAGGPVTVTHAEMKRYFMTISEAVQLVLQAAAHGVARPDQRGKIFVLDMGPPVRIVDLARSMIVLAGLRPEIDISIRFTGLRPGEKLFEELFEADEQTEPSGADGVFVATARRMALSDIRKLVEGLEASALAGDEKALRAKLRLVTPSVAPDSASMRMT